MLVEDVLGVSDYPYKRGDLPYITYVSIRDVVSHVAILESSSGSHVT